MSVATTNALFDEVDESMRGIKIIDVDTHLTEPADLWTSRAPRNLLDRVPRVVRAPDLTASMSYYLIEQISAIPNIIVRPCTEVIETVGDEHLERMVLRDMKTGEKETVDCGHLFVFIGAEPRTDWLDGVIARDGRGFVLTGPDLQDDQLADWTLSRPPYHLETSVPGVFVAGDVRSESAKRVASAVGEGAMAVMLVHRYLEGS